MERWRSEEQTPNDRNMVDDDDKPTQWPISSDVNTFPNNPNFRMFRNEIVFACKFHVEPKMMEYYHYHSRLLVEGRVEEIQVLFRSPEFKGGFETKWRILACLNRWEETTRWISLYLSRIDQGDNKYLGGMRSPIELTCEFRIVDKKRAIIKSLRSSRTITEQGDTRGFSKFLPFSDALKGITDNSLHVEAHLTLFVVDEEAAGDNDKTQKNYVSPVDLVEADYGLPECSDYDIDDESTPMCDVNQNNVNLRHRKKSSIIHLRNLEHVRVTNVQSVPITQQLNPDNFPRAQVYKIVTVLFLLFVFIHLSFNRMFAAYPYLGQNFQVIIFVLIVLCLTKWNEIRRVWSSYHT